MSATTKKAARERLWLTVLRASSLAPLALVIGPRVHPDGLPKAMARERTAPLTRVREVERPSPVRLRDGLAQQVLTASQARLPVRLPDPYPLSVPAPAPPDPIPIPSDPGDRRLAAVSDGVPPARVPASLPETGEAGLCEPASLPLSSGSGANRTSAGERPGARTPEVREVKLAPGQSRVIEFAGLNRVAVADPEVADVAPVSTRELVLTARRAGVTDVHAWDRSGRVSYRVIVTAPSPPSSPAATAELLTAALQDPAIRVRVLGDTLFLEGTVTDAYASRRAEMLAQALTPQVKNLIQVQAPPVAAPVSAPALSEAAAGTVSRALEQWNIQARPVSPTAIVVEGTIAAADAERIRRLIADASGPGVTVLDALRVAAPDARQIMIRARVVDINRVRLKDVGVDWGNAFRAGGQNFISDQPFLFGIFGQPFQGDLDVRSLDPLGARLNLLIQENAARILSEPNLLVLEGAKGNILVGGEFPYPQVQNVVGGLGSVSVAFKEFGVQLGVEPLSVSSAGDITLRVSPEVSLLDFANAVEISGFTLPALRTRREDSTVRIRSGQTLAIGGLIDNSISQNVRRIPLLSKIPILGELFKSRSFIRNESELVILITPEIVPDGVAPTPTPLSEEAPNLPVRRPSVPESIHPGPSLLPPERREERRKERREERREERRK